MNIRRAIARWLGYGGIEWPKSAIVDMPIRFISTMGWSDANIMPVCCYPGGIQVIPGEIGCDGSHRLILGTNPIYLYRTKANV